MFDNTVEFCILKNTFEKQSVSLVPLRYKHLRLIDVDGILQRKI